jgi:phosphatidylserine decarboxylase
MKFDRAALPFVAGALAPGILLALTGRHRAAAPWVALAGFMLYFFRDPDRVAPDGRGLVLSPADGRVLFAGSAQPGVAPPGTWLQVSIFLSPLDVHINRMPVAGVIQRVRCQPGRFLPAYRPESAQQNSFTETWIDTGTHTVVARQVVGVLARRIVCRAAAGQRVQAGQRFGLMKFGSRMDVFVPPGSMLLVREGDAVRGGETVVARLPEPAETPA